MSEKDSIEILSRLISFKSVSKSQNLDIADYIEDFSRQIGGKVQRFRASNGTNASLLITFGPMAPGGLVWSGHMDVVPAAGQSWSSDPFVLRRGEDRLFGRGSVDMKGFLAICLSVAAGQQHDQLKRPLHLAFTYDEESTCEGIKPIVAYINERMPRPSAVIVGEPTEMRAVGAHKGVLDLMVEVNGRAAHSSLPHLGANAVHAAARIICEIDKLGRVFKNQPSEVNELYDVPYPTVSANVISGGDAGNVIPSNCRLQIEARTLEHGQEATIAGRISEYVAHEIIPDLRLTAPEADAVLTKLYGMPPLMRQPGSAAEALVSNFSASSQIEAVSYATEAGFFQAAGLPTVVFGPGSIAQAHQADEYITFQQFKKGEQTFTEIARTLAQD